MNRLTIKKHTLFKFVCLISSIGYGFFIVAYLNNHYILDSGDIISIIKNSDEMISLNDILTYHGSVMNILSSGDAIFHIALLVLKNLLNQSSLTVLGIYAFIISTTIFYIYSINIKQRKYLFFILLLFIMIFFTPRVINLFASGLRSGIAFTVLIIAFMYFKGVKQYILFALSTLIHLSMAPIIAFYILFNMIEATKVKLSFTISLFILLLCSYLFAMVTPKLTFAYSPSFNQSMLYMSLVAFLALLITFTNKKVVRNVYGFISIGLILTVLVGYINDFSFVRYIGNAIIFYLFFLIKEGSPRTLHFFAIGYAPFFLLTLYYSIANYW